jgi:hypothetical protein
VPADIQTAASDVAAGTATAGETETYQAYIDWSEYNSGVSASQVSFQSIAGQSGNAAWQSDPFLMDMQAAESSATAGGGVEAATGAELLTAGEDLGLLASGAAETAAGAVCVGTVGCVVAVGAVAAGVVIGSKVVSLFSGGSAPDAWWNAGANSGAGPQSPSVVTKVWYVPDSRYGQQTGPGGTLWRAMRPQCNINGTCSNVGFMWTGGNLSATNGYPGQGLGEPVVPWTQTLPGGGVWFMHMTFGSTVYSGVGSAINEVGPDPTGDNCAAQTNGYTVAWATSLPGTAHSQNQRWKRNDWPTSSTCSPVNAQLPVPQMQSEQAYELATKGHLGFPRTGTCTTAAYVSCNNVSALPATSWCVTGTCVANLFGTGNYPDLRQFVDSAIGATNPATGSSNQPGTGTVPSSCVGASPAACKASLTSSGFTAAPVETTLTPAQSDLTKPAGAVVTTSPAPGTYVDLGTVVTLTENPNPLPVVMPAPLTSGETYSQYIARLRTLGWAGAYTNVFVTDANINPALGPDAVLSVSPTPGTRVQPTDAVQTTSNPDAAPAAGATGAAPVGPTAPGITIPTASTPCNIFPFGIPCWMVNQLSSLASVSPQAPSFSFNVPYDSSTWNINLGSVFGVDTSSIMAIVRPVLLFMSAIGLMVWLGSAALGGSFHGSSAPAGGSAEEE